MSAVNFRDRYSNFKLQFQQRKLLVRVVCMYFLIGHVFNFTLLKPIMISELRYYIFQLTILVNSKFGKIAAIFCCCNAHIFILATKSLYAVHRSNLYVSSLSAD